MPSLDRSAIDADADRVVRKLTRAGYKAYLVGGCVRDLLVGRTPKDFDVATSATPNEIKATFRNSRIIGRRFRLAHVFFGSKIIETATFRANPRDEDAADLLIRRDNVFGSETEDARRRDFTINGLFYDVEREEVIDHVGGLADLEAKLIRTIGDPDVRFQEDPVRMLRAIKFAARLGFGFEPTTWRALLRWRSEISKCAPPRLLEGLGAPTAPPPVEGNVPRPTVPRVEYDEEDPAERDIDDPEEEPGSIPVNGEPEAEPLEEELDDEEREWHRVWADEPPARPAHAAQVRLSFAHGADVIAARTLAWNALAELDLAGSGGHDPSNAVAFGVLLAPFLGGELRGGELHGAVHEVSHPLIQQLHVTRRDSERLRFILIAQRKLAHAKKRGAQAELAGGRELVDDSLLLFALLERAAGGTGELPQAVATNEGREDEEGGNGAEDDDDPNRPRKRRRRRRGGRRRRGESHA